MLTADETLLFRFSALTYNAHRIHYDRNWVREEGYSDLIVHGPLQALMMGELVRRRGDGLGGKQLAYRLVSPMIGPQTFTVAAGEAGVNAGAEVRDVHGTLTAVGSIQTVDPTRQ
jgi:3-methylfumaryl-CoA hydratase